MAAEPANAVTIKIPEDIEYRVLGNFFGLLIACGGLLTGTMMAQHSLEYWLDDIVPLVLAFFMAYRLMRNFTTTVLSCQIAPPLRQQSRQRVMPEAVAMGQLPPVPGYTPDQVLEEVAKRIEAKRALAGKKQPNE